MNPHLKSFGLTTLMFLVIRGVTFFTLPSLVTRIYGTNSWILIPAYVLVTLGGMALLIKGMEKHHQQSIFEVVHLHFPPFIAKLFSCLLILNFLAVGLTIINEYISMFQFTVDSSVRISRVAIFLIIAVLIVASHGLYTMTKTSIILFLISFWIIFIEILLFNDFSLTRLTPFFFRGGQFNWKGALAITYSFLGFEMLMVMSPFISKTTKAFRAVTYSYLMLCVYFTMYIILSQGLVSILQIPKIRFITLRLYGASRFPTVEYITDFLFFFFIFSAIMSSALYIWAANEGMLKLVRRKHSRTNYVLIGAVFIIIMALNISSRTWQAVSFWVGFVETCIVVICILLLLVLPYKQKVSHSSDLSANSSTSKDPNEEMAKEVP
ncbi:GerAB/ArcD/ProY family transporter [Paenibacillus aquistagni]|uniref:Spore germination protein n=1 Tax=Paenibacillus aquistagni TaxID=1852522 RepID=A0A1X7LIH3_9BACL|nr:GerAB/ArcD/ProY family transporter [Paenibacillus aquistagni]SMG53688.1 Spore germination protein [Paenibacillus aquistagni]